MWDVNFEEICCHCVPFDHLLTTRDHLGFLDVRGPPTLEISNCCSKSVLCADAFLNACDAGHHAMQSRSVWFTDASNLWSRTLLIWSFLCQLLTTEMVVRFHTSLVKKLLDFVQPGRSGKWMGIVDNSHPQVSRASISTNKRCKCSSRQRWQCTERGNPSSGS
jgi:hypothetical protein